MPDADELRTLIEQIKLPARFGAITSRHLPNGRVKGVVACVQDLPGNVSVYKNTSKIVRFLAEHHSFEWVFTGAAFGECSFQPCDELPRHRNRRLALKMLRQGLASGVEYAAMTQPDLSIEMFGIDDPELYLLNVKQVTDMLKLKDSMSALITRLRDDILKISGPILSADLADFIRFEREHLHGSSDYSEVYMEHLVMYARMYSVTIPFSIHTEVQRAWERKHRRLIPRLLSMMSSRNENRSSSEIVTDCRRLRISVLDVLCKTVADRAVVEVLAILEQVLRAYRIELTADLALDFLTLDKQGVQATLRKNIDQINECLNVCLGPTRPQLRLSDSFNAVFDQWSAPEGYCRIATERSEFMSARLAPEMAKHGLDRAIFHEGGFHMMFCVDNLLARHSIGSIVITPRVESLKSIYIDEMFHPDELARSGLKGSLNPHPLSDPD